MPLTPPASIYFSQQFLIKIVNYNVYNQIRHYNMLDTYCDTQKHIRGKILLKTLRSLGMCLRKRTGRLLTSKCMHEFPADEIYLQIRPFIRQCLITFLYLMVPYLFKQVGAYLRQP
jgi:hypothetical protein